MVRILTLALLALTLQAQPAEAESLPAPVISALKNHQLDGGGLSVFVQDVNEDEPLLDFNSGVPRSPASVIKLVTTFAALDLLGPAYEWTTEVWITGPVQDGRLEGDLVLRGGGDPALSTERFWTMLREIRAHGIYEIAGDLVIDDSRFAPAAGQPGDFDKQPFRAYNVQPSALLVNHNIAEFRVRHGASGVEVYVDPPLQGFLIENRIAPRRGACSGFQRGVGFHLPGGLEGQRAVLSGSFPSGCPQYSLWRAVLPAPQFVDGLFRVLWFQLGGLIEGGLRVEPVPEGAGLIYTHRSPPLAEQVRQINKWSNNAMTRHLFLTLGIERYGAPGTLEKGRDAISEWFASREIEIPGLYIDNGSGLSRRTRITARGLGEMLLDAWRHPYMAELMSSMPVAAIDGTLRNRHKGEMAGRLHLKTGTLDDVSALAGLMLAKNGHRYVVVIIMNEPGAHRGSGEAVQAAILRSVFRR